MTHPNRKRKRSSIQPNEESSVTQAKVDRRNLPFSSSSHSKIWQGLTIVISTRQSTVQPNPQEEESLSSLSHCSYKSLTQLCRSLGASVTAQVHSQVHCVLASAAALQSPPTQRVRQAWRRGIPVVPLVWLEECRAQRQILPLTPYRVMAPSVPSQTRARTLPSIHGSGAAKNDDDDHAVMAPRVLDLGCCCACHDVDDSRTDCEWCVDCPVNTARNPAT